MVMKKEKGWAEFFRVIGHPVRLRILERLVKDPACVKDIWGCLELPQAVVSQHLAVLRAKGIVGCEREGAAVRYFVKDKRVPRVIQLMEEGCLKEDV